MMERGTYARISRKSGVPYETVRRYYSGGNVGIINADKIRAIEAEEAEDADAANTKNSGKTDEKQTESRKSSDGAVKAST